VRTSFDVGDRPRTTWTVQLDGDVTDPPFVALLVLSPAGEDVSFYGEANQPRTIFRDSEGVYYADIPLTTSGRWARRWVAFDENGVALDAYERSFQVIRSAFTSPLPATP
jgi:hypothetical protein